MKKKPYLILSIFVSVAIVLIIGYFINKYVSEYKKDVEYRNNLIEISILDENETQIKTQRDDYIDENSFSSIYKDFDAVIKNIQKLNDDYYILEILDYNYGYINILLKNEEYQAKMFDLKKDTHIKGTCNNFNNEFYKDCSYQTIK